MSSEKERMSCFTPIKKQCRMYPAQCPASLVTVCFTGRTSRACIARWAKLAPEGPDRVTARLYSEVLDMEVTAVGMEIPWAGGEDAYLMACEKPRKLQKKK